MIRIAPNLTYRLLILFGVLYVVSCKNGKPDPPAPVGTETSSAEDVKVEQEAEIKQTTEVSEPRDSLADFRLTTENALDFFMDYGKSVTEDRVEFTTSMGSFTVELYDNVPYHKANMIYLAKRHYFDTTQFHRVVKDFIIQGGSSDDPKLGRKRAQIGRYLLPPDTKKGYKHHRGVISMPSSEQYNAYKRASPYEFFIVVTDPGSYHLDGDYTPFGRVIKGMDVVDKINKVPVDEGDWPMQNVYIWTVRAY